MTEWTGSDLYRALAGFRRRLLGHETEAVYEFRETFGTARLGIEKRLRALAQSKSTSDGFIFDRLRELSRQIADLLNEQAEPGARIAAEGQSAVLGQVTGEAETLTKFAAGVVPEGAVLPWNVLPSRAVQALVGFASDGSPLAAIYHQAAAGEGEAVRQLLADGIAQGKNPRAVARQMAGRFGQSQARMETIARTEMLRAYREASRQSFAANPDVVTRYQRVAVCDARTCAACFALHGTQYDTSEPIAIHPCCRCAVVPVTRSWGEILGADADGIPDTRPVIATPDALFGRLSDGDKRRVLGAGGYDLWQSGKAKLTDFARVENDPRWGATVRTATLTELAGD